MRFLPRCVSGHNDLPSGRRVTPSLRTIIKTMGKGRVVFRGARALQLRRVRMRLHALAGIYAMPLRGSDRALWKAYIATMPHDPLIFCFLIFLSLLSLFNFIV